MPRRFEEQELLERVDNDREFLGETVQMLSAEGPALLSGIRRATEQGDAPAVARGAHALKGMISNFCSPSAHASASELERIGMGGDLSPAPIALDRLEADLGALIADLTDFLGTGA
jgi:HPt (histidine-containing phosphotransfer) domain-containing protein